MGGGEGGGEGEEDEGDDEQQRHRQPSHLRLRGGEWERGDEEDARIWSTQRDVTWNRGIVGASTVRGVGDGGEVMGVCWYSGAVQQLRLIAAVAQHWPGPFEEVKGE